ncbi:hypothetical protein N7490_003565 [Penicillium lividum]|nr:hypothetical protein N7490_003565 [Penicillium lividum]
MTEHKLRLLCFDGGGVRGLSSLMLLQHLMETIDPINPPKPCDYFDMIGGTSTGGAFHGDPPPVNWRGKVQGRCDEIALEQAIKKILKKEQMSPDELLKDAHDANCKVFVCATSRETGRTVCLTSYFSPSWGTDLLNKAKIWEACRATSAASSFFNPITIGDYGETFVDGATGANNPVRMLWSEAQSIWGSQSELLENKIQCLVSIGTGMPSLKPFGTHLLNIARTLCDIAIETEITAENFQREKESLDISGRYFRFNVIKGLEEIGLEKASVIPAIAAATRAYVRSPQVMRQLEQCRDGPLETQVSHVSHYHNVESNNAMFVGRKTELESMSNLLFTDGACSSLAVVGLGGVGKTQLALEFANNVRKYRPEYSIFWVSAFSIQRFEKACADIVEELQLAKTKNTTESPEECSKTLLKRYLSSEKSGKWLLILDNVDDEELVFGDDDQSQGVEPFLPTSPQGLILITTRFQEIAIELADRRLVLKGMSPQEGKILLTHALDRKDQDGMEQLLEELTYLPLAIAQAVAFINRNSTTVTRYIELLKKPEQEFELEIQLEQAIGTLCAYHFLVQKDDGVTYEMHRLVHLATRAWLNKEELNHEEDIAVKHLNQVFEIVHPGFQPVNLRLSSSYLPHGIRLLKNTEERKTMERLFLCLRVGYALDINGRKREGSSWFKEVADSDPDPTDVTFNGSLIRLKKAFRALLLSKEGKTQGSIEILNNLLQDTEELPENSSARLNSQMQLATAYMDNKQPGETVKLLESLIHVRVTSIAPDDPSLLKLKHQLAIALRGNGQIQESIHQFQSIIEMRKKSPQDDELLLSSQRELARTYRNHGESHEAIKLMQHIVKVQSSKKPNDASLLSSQSELAIAYRENGQIPKAIEILRHVVKVRAEDLPESHADLLFSQHDLAVTLGRDGQSKESINILENVLKMRQNCLVKDHPHCLNTQYDLAKIYEGNGRLQEAIQLLKHVASVRESDLPETNPDRLRSQHALAIALQRDGQFEKATGILETVLKIRQKSLGKDHPHYVETQNDIAMICRHVERSLERDLGKGNIISCNR